MGSLSKISKKIFYLSFTGLLSPFLFGTDYSFFESKIRPVLASKCYNCHSADAKKIKGGLRLDHVKFILEGGDSGPVLVAGHPEKSLLIEAISYDDPELHMPPKEKLSKSIVDDFKNWITRGAIWPEEAIPVGKGSERRSRFNIDARVKEHWCWKPIDPSSPVTLTESGLHPIDQVVRNRLQAEGLLPAEKADRFTWLRRVSYDLVGLPPSSEEIQKFTMDRDINAKEKVVDRLLGSPQFGEKWARHWMDLVRYAETCGHEFDFPLENPHEYRDYLIRALNQDLPYDQFLREHIAGDLLEDPRLNPEEKFNESIIGTGFWYFHEAVHGPTDSKVDNADRMENQLDVFGKTFLGLTIGCARCHDHKFDAISDEDYYSLASYMQGSNRQEYPLDPGGERKQIAEAIEKVCRDAFVSLHPNSKSSFSSTNPSQYWEAVTQHFLSQNQESNRSLENPVDVSLVKKIANTAGLNSKILGSWFEHFNQQESLFSIAQNFKSKKSQFKNFLLKEKVFFENSVSFADFKFNRLPDGWNFTGEAFMPRAVGLLRLGSDNLFSPNQSFSSNILGDKRIGNLRSPHFQIEHENVFLKVNAHKAFIRLVIDNYHMGKHSKLLFNGTFHEDLSTNGLFKWIKLGNPKYKNHSAYLEIVDRGSDAWVEIDEVRFSNQGPPVAPISDFAYLFTLDYADSALLPEALDQFMAMISPKLGVAALSHHETTFLNYLVRHGLVDTSLHSLVLDAKKKFRQIDAKTPKERYVMAMGKGSRYQGNVYVRGSPHKLGESVAGRNLTALGGREGDRLVFAEQLVLPENPLVSRVMVNRIWLQLFGRGIVSTPDDFGPMGEKPSHPQLLDWLAADFMRNRWSIKHAIRQMVLSETYQQSSLSNKKNDPAEITLKDPQNILLHRFPVRRLQAEWIRDSLLMFSGKLDRKMFGPSVPVHKTAFMTGRGAKENGPLDGAGRRSLYGSVYRNFLSPFMLAFDQPAPFGTKGRRSVSNVPAQSLAMLNDPFVIELCNHLGKQIATGSGKDEQKVESLYFQITGKKSTPSVSKKLVSFIDKQTELHKVRDFKVWSDLAHVLINSKNFIFLN
jgi:hypothetical protein